MRIHSDRSARFPARATLGAVAPWARSLLLASLAAACGENATGAKPDAAAPDAAADDGGQPGAELDGGDGSNVDSGIAGDSGAGYAWNLPSWFPVPLVPADNPISEAKVSLGRHLFYDARLSGNGTQSCATCHMQEKAFSDGRATGLGSTGEAHSRGPMGLANVAYAANLTWANPLQRSLEQQALVPMFGQNPVELGLAGQEDVLRAMFKDDATYRELFASAFGDADDLYGPTSIVRAIASFERTLISAHSPYDRYFFEGDDTALSVAAKRGLSMFFASERFECFHCHGGFAFADSVTHVGKVTPEEAFHNNGLYNIDGRGGYPAPNRGLYEITSLPDDMGRFKAPTLRNIAVTAPYMHDGSIATLEGVLDHYAAGGRTITSGPYAGDGSKSHQKSEFVHGFIFTGSEKDDLLAFLNSLTDDAFLADPRHADPWPVGSPAKAKPKAP